MKRRLTEKDILLLEFLCKYKMMLATDSKKIYKSKEYYLKRLKVLEKEQYIKRVNRYYIKLDIKGIKLVKELGCYYRNVCRKEKYQERVQEIMKIATLTLDSDIIFLTSWEIKDSNVFTEMGRTFIGILNYYDNDYITYYISKNKSFHYVRQVINDVNKNVQYNKSVVFMEDFKNLNKSNKYFIFGKESTLIINPTKENLDRIRLLQEIDCYDILLQIYKGKEILLSNWTKADYMTEDKQYILFMPFIDTEKLHRLNIAFNNNEKSSRKIDIVTLKENKEKIEEILTGDVNIVELDEILLIKRTYLYEL